MEENTHQHHGRDTFLFLRPILSQTISQSTISTRTATGSNSSDSSASDANVNGVPVRVLHRRRFGGRITGTHCSHVSSANFAATSSLRVESQFLLQLAADRLDSPSRSQISKWRSKLARSRSNCTFRANGGQFPTRLLSKSVTARPRRASSRRVTTRRFRSTSSTSIRRRAAWCPRAASATRSAARCV